MHDTAVGVGGVDRTMQDRSEIVDIVARHCIFQDTLQFVRSVDELFTDDVVEDHGPAFGGALVGRDAVRAVWQQMSSYVEASQHLLGGHRVDVRGDDAQGIFYVQGSIWLKERASLGPMRPADFIVAVAYLMHFRRTGEGWKVSRMAVHNFAPSSGVSVGAYPPAYEAGLGEKLLGADGWGWSG